MFRLFSQLPRTRQEIEKHIEAMRHVVLSEEHQDVFDHLYACLSILDGKSSAMLSFNSIIIAVFAIFLTGDLTTAELTAAGIGMFAILVSAVLILFVAWVHWSTTDDLSDGARHARVLIRVRNSRTVRYRLAWYCAVASLTCLCLLLVLRIGSGPSD